MTNITIFIWILTLTICNFCGNDFLVIGRHSWRCKARSRSSSVNDDIVTNGNTSNMDHASLYLDNQHNNQSNSVVMCCCGKHCKGYKGLKIHQRSCKFIFGLREDLTKTLVDHVVENHERPEYSETDELNDSNQSESNTSDHSNVKNGVQLPKTSDQWATAESFFKAELPTHEIGKDNLELITQKLSDTIYDYFDREFGSVVNTSDTEFKVNTKIFRNINSEKL